MSANRSGTGDAESPNREQPPVTADDLWSYLDSETSNLLFWDPSSSSVVVQSESSGQTSTERVDPIEEPLPDRHSLTPSDFDKMFNPSNKNFPVNVASGGIHFVLEECSWGTSTEIVSEEDLYVMDQIESKELLDTTSQRLPVWDPSSSSVVVQSESSGQTSTEQVVPIEELLPDRYSLTPSDFDEIFNPSNENLSSVCSGLDYPSTSTAGSSMDPDAGGAAGSHYVPLPRELVPSGIRNEGIQVTLLDREVWNELFRQDHEMLVRDKPRYLSPLLQFRISGLDKMKFYSVFLEFPMRNNYSWKYEKSTWLKERTIDMQDKDPIVEHPRSPSPGHYWMARGNPINFKHVMLTTRSGNVDPKMVCLKLSHAYLLKITVTEVDESKKPIMETGVSVSFQETGFIVVSSYRNKQVQQLKSLCWTRR